MEISDSRVKMVKMTKSLCFDLIANIAGVKITETKNIKDFQQEYENKSSNRPIDKKYLKQYIHDMNTGKWDEKVIDSPVLISSSGIILGGQHRLLAFANSEREEIKFPVIVDATDTDRAFQDTGKNRSANDRLSMAVDPAQKKLMEKGLKPLTASKIKAALKTLTVHRLDLDRDPSDAESAETANNVLPILEQISKILKTDPENKDKYSYRTPAALAAMVAIKSKLTESRWLNIIHFLNGDVLDRADWESFRKYNLALPVGAVGSGQNVRDRAKIFTKILGTLPTE